MKHKLNRTGPSRGMFAAALLLTALTAQRSTLFAQGSLTPPGAPGPTFKTLSQVEPRTAITNSTAVTISQPGSYYLTTNITGSSGDAVTITANNVTLDLAGFTISSTANPAAGTGILLGSSRQNITILNGFISGGVTNNSGTYSGSGFGSGITFAGIDPYFTNSPYNVRITGVTVSGCQLYGIYLYLNHTLVESCAVSSVGSYGISAWTVSDSTADAGAVAISAEIANNSSGFCTGNDYGLLANNAANCYGSSSTGYGLYANFAAHNCHGVSGGTGLYAADAENCDGRGGNGLQAGVANNCYGQSYNSTGYGLQANAANNCSGYANGANSALAASTTAINCYGVNSGSGIGVDAAVASNCYGISSSGTGLHSLIIANGCYGQSNTGIGLNGFMVNTCRGIGSPGLSVAHNFNSF
jgi:hypothetical protein